MPFVAIVGGMCYSYYLMHMLIISVVFKATRHLVVLNDFALNYAVQVDTLGTAIGPFGTLYYILIERPCMDPAWPRKLWTKCGHPTHPQASLPPARETSASRTHMSAESTPWHTA